MDELVLKETLIQLEEVLLMLDAAGSMLAIQNPEHKPPAVISRKIWVLNNLIAYLKDEKAINDLTGGDK